VLDGLRELGDSGLLAELAGLFVRDATEYLAALGWAVEGDDAAAVERISHTLKGSSGNMGVGEMARIRVRLEAGRDLSGTPALLERLQEEFARVRPALEAEMEGDDA
jgi:HPt (histidine-containing phosphotransfer) domain-containing protein